LAPRPSARPAYDSPQMSECFMCYLQLYCDLLFLHMQTAIDFDYSTLNMICFSFNCRTFKHYWKQNFIGLCTWTSVARICFYWHGRSTAHRTEQSISSNAENATPCGRRGERHDPVTRITWQQMTQILVEVATNIRLR